MSPVVLAAIVARAKPQRRKKRAIRLGEHVFCHPREGGDPVFHRRFRCLLDSRLRGNDKKGSVPTLPSKPIPLRSAPSSRKFCIARKRRYPAASATECGAAAPTRTACSLGPRRNTSSANQRNSARAAHSGQDVAPQTVPACDQNGISSSRSLSKLGLAPLLLSLRAPPLAGRRSLPVS